MRSTLEGLGATILGEARTAGSITVSVARAAIPTLANQDSVRWIEWGTFDVCGKRHGKTEKGKVGVGKDIRVIGLEVTEWKERKGHTLAPSMITGVYNKGTQTLVIGVGVEGAIDYSEETVRTIKRNGIAEVLLQRTPEACRTYSAALRRSKPAALLAHGTC